MDRQFTNLDIKKDCDYLSYVTGKIPYELLTALDEFHHGTKYQHTYTLTRSVTPLRTKRRMQIAQVPCHLTVVFYIKWEKKFIWNLSMIVHD